MKDLHVGGSGLPALAAPPVRARLRRTGMTGWFTQPPLWRLNRRELPEGRARKPPPTASPHPSPIPGDLGDVAAVGERDRLRARADLSTNASGPRPVRVSSNVEKIIADEQRRLGAAGMISRSAR
ncbi:hypothetical protein MKL09_12625 [Methylobacterium sp. J-048]|uniref:hypothetical protein n=1 Tax=Methylobacterium sp. J-048 TaxID=2836635 RepID=UPI001FB911DA|nr:hypothetical protein [Methylobacterium sp. J-048]MCJ2057401.1 hypothetical protein [Methylobacterium sp. J-048]